MAASTNVYGSSLNERRAVGRAARQRLPRKAAGEWNPAIRGHDALATVLAQNALRSASLVPIRHGRMSASPWAYYRGAAAVMAADLASRPDSGLTVQLCGDAHVLNFGMWATPERQLSFDLRDFDETLPGPFEWDVMRMIASLQVLACNQGMDMAAEGDRAVRTALKGYRDKIADYADTAFLDIWYEQFTAEDLVSYFGAHSLGDVRLLSDRAKRLMWLGPVLCLVLCVIGGLVALVLYYHLLDWIRKDLRQIRMAQVVTG